MSIQEAVIEQLQTLSVENQRKVLEFVQTLQKGKEQAPHRKDPKGMFADRGVHITAEEIDEARRQAWELFPRAFPEGSDS
jgi:hypothetical protein